MYLKVSLDFSDKHIARIQGGASVIKAALLNFQDLYLMLCGTEDQSIVI